jgi:hypothetical protein
MLMAIFGAILPRFAILAGWVNDQAGWQAAFVRVWLLGGFLFFPGRHSSTRSRSATA